MASHIQNIAETTDFILGRRPVLESILRAFAPILEARDALGCELSPKLADAGLELASFIGGESEEPVLAREPIEGLGPYMAMTAEKILPLLYHLQPLEPYKNELEDFFIRPQTGSTPDLREQLANAIFHASQEELGNIAKKSGMPPQILDFAATFIISPLLRALLANHLAGKDEAPWDMEGVWQQGYCPVCGSYPSIAWLDRRSFDEKNAYISGGGGKKHFHCFLCGANWKFRRAVCPSCGMEGEGVMEILKEQGSHGERIDWCTKCRSYCPVTDLRELEKIPNMDVMTLGMIHLDMVAAGKDMMPLKFSFWNMF